MLCQNKRCYKPAKPGKAYCSTECFYAIAAQVALKGPPTTRIKKRNAALKKIAMVEKRKAKAWYEFKESLPILDWQEALTEKSHIELAKEYNLNRDLLKIYLEIFEKVDLRCASVVRSRVKRSNAQPSSKKKKENKLHEEIKQEAPEKCLQDLIKEEPEMVDTARLDDLLRRGGR